MLYPISAIIPFAAQFVTGGAGAPGLTVYVSVVRVTSAGVTTTIITQASNTAATEVSATDAKGLYCYWLAAASTGTEGIYIATFHSAGTCDLHDVPALEIVGPAWVAAAAAANSVAPDNASVTAIKAKTDNLPSDPADASDIAASFSTVSSTLSTIASYIDTEVAAIKAKTDLIPAAPAAVGDIPTALAISDVVWDELMAGHVIADSAGVYMAASGAASDPLLNTVPGAYASGTAGAALGRIGSGQIVTTSPVAPDGDVTIWAGYDMLAADGYSLDWTDASNVWPTLTGATIAMICRGPSTMTFVGSVVTATGASKKVRVELQDTQTVDMPISNHWVYDVAATLTGGDIVPLVKGGRLYVKAKPG